MPPGAQTSLEDRFLQFYLESIEKLEECWLGPDGLKEKTFGRQLLFLISLLPDLEKQKELREKWQEASKQLDNDESISGENAAFISGMSVVTEVLIFVVSGLELVDINITGPATSSLIELPEHFPEKQFQRAEQEIPNITPEQVQEVTAIGQE